MPSSPDSRPFRVLIVDLVGLTPGADGIPSSAEVEAYIAGEGARFHAGSAASCGDLEPDRVHFFYCPDLSAEADIMAEAAHGYDAVIAAATIIPEEARFPMGGVRIGAGTGNMRSRSWGGGGGEGGGAPLMNTPGVNSRATAQMVMKAILRVKPDLPFDRLHDLSGAGRFDTGRNLREFPTQKLEGQRLAVIGYGNIGRQVARLGAAFGMEVAVHARPRHRDWIEAEGLAYAATIAEAAEGADVLSVHIGLGALDPSTGTYQNSGRIDAAVLQCLAPGALLVNFDRGEVVDVAALEAALATGQTGHAAIDADLFVSERGEVSGPLAPYLPLARRFAARVLLLPHATADTDHPTRVAGARQAVRQILDVLRERKVSNLVGDCPEGFSDAGARPVPGVGEVTPSQLAGLKGDPRLAALAADLKAFAALVEALASGADVDEIARQGVLSATRIETAIRRLALQGPYAADKS